MYALSGLIAYKIHRTPTDQYNNLQTCHSTWKENNLNYSSTLIGNIFKFKYKFLSKEKFVKCISKQWMIYEH